MSIKVLVVVFVGLLFIPAACAPPLITAAVAASPASVSSPPALACPASPVFQEITPEVQAALPVESAPVTLAPAGVFVQSLVLEPNVVELGNNVTVEVTVINTGTVPVVYPLAIKIEGMTIKTLDVALAAGESKNLNLTISAPITDGVYHVSAGDIIRELDAWS